jgi:hypothetical protein
MLNCEVNLTPNSDGYFVVTGHSVEERFPGKWKLEDALLDFSK